MLAGGRTARGAHRNTHKITASGQHGEVLTNIFRRNQSFDIAGVIPSNPRVAYYDVIPGAEGQEGCRTEEQQ